MEYADSYILDHYQLATRWLFDSIRILRFQVAAASDENHQESRMHILSLVLSKTANLKKFGILDGHWHILGVEAFDADSKSTPGYRNKDLCDKMGINAP